ncbi:hypothetical protein [Rhodoferax sp. UBA5149]|uniref:hypothetical protein n=1 Tax=Rhodoferax sp. UBA5149 TaxID=1947379 RepID=UPI0025EE8AFF|nr:hypothetical protein [Rhodoferax sp. UBA5149]
MDEYRHHVLGFFVSRDEANIVFLTLVERGVPRERLELFETDSASPRLAPQTHSNAVLKDVLIDGAIGTVTGAIARAVTKPKEKEGWFSDRVRDAISSGQLVLVVDTRTEQETAVARDVISASVSEYRETSPA